MEQLSNSELPELLRPFDAAQRVRALLEISGEGIIAGAETFLAASAHIESGTVTQIPRDVLFSAIKEADRLTLRVPQNRPQLVGHLRTIRGLRPAWFTGPVYSELLAPFTEEVQKLTGMTPQQVFELLLKVSTVPSGAAPPVDALRRLPESLLIDYDQIKEPSDFRDRAFLRVENWLFPLAYQMADATYRALCAELRKSLPKFLDRKGDSLELAVSARFAQHAPNWSWIPNFRLASSPDQEHDLIGFRGNFGVAIECKSLNLRPSSMDWSTLNALSDAGPLLEGLGQVSPVLGLFRRGGSVLTPGGSRDVPSLSRPKGLIITDEVFTPYLRAFLDPPTSGGSLDLPPADWHGATVTILSVVDLQFLLQASGSFSTFLEFCDWISKRPRVRMVDTPELWLLYCVDPMTRLTAMGAPIVAEYEELWGKIAGRDFSELRPPWLTNHAKVAADEDKGRLDGAISIIRRDRDAARRYFPSSDQLEALSPFWRDNLELTRRDPWRIRERTAGSPPLLD